MTTKLKGGVNYYTYVWYANPTACAKCLQMHGKTFTREEDIPDLLHPNCQCWIETIDNKKGQNSGDSGNDLKDKIEVLIGDIKSLEDEVTASVSNFNELSNQNKDSSIKSIINSYVDELNNLNNKLSSLLDRLCSLESLEVLSDIAIDSAEQEYYDYEGHYQNMLKYFDREIENQKKNNENEFEKDIKKHEEILDLIRHVHDKGGEELLNGRKEVRTEHDKKTGMDAKVYENDKEVVIVFPGSDLTSFEDVKTDFADIPFRRVNTQYESAKKLYQDVANNPKYKDKEIIISGYSLGGNIAAQIGAENNKNTVVFEPYYRTDRIIQKRADKTGEAVEINPKKVIIYQQERDGITKIKEKGRIGKIYEIPNGKYDFKFMHDLDNIGSLLHRNPKGELKNPKTIYYPKNRL